MKVSTLLVDACEQELASFVSTLLEDENSLAEIMSEIQEHEAWLLRQQSTVLESDELLGMSSLDSEGQQLNNHPECGLGKAASAAVSMDGGIWCEAPAAPLACAVPDDGEDAQRLDRTLPSSFALNEEVTLKLRWLYRMKTLQMFRIEKKRLLQKFIHLVGCRTCASVVGTQK
jgi:hypothetical protein